MSTTHRMRPLFQAALGGLLLLGASCSSTGAATKASKDPDSPWVEASPLLRMQVEDEIRRLPWTHGFQRLEQIRWLASVGEPAYEQLLKTLEDPRDDVVASALAALGATFDPRLVPYVKGVHWQPERERSDLNLERARTLLRLGDWGDIPVLLEGLRDDRVYTRSLCIEALEEATRETLGYDAHGEPKAREEAVLRWERWWISRSGDRFLVNP